MKSEDAAQLLARGIMAEYEKLRAEILQRSATQEKAIQTGFALTGGLLFFLLSKNIIGLSAEAFIDCLVGSISKDTSKNTATLYVLFAGYVFALLVPCIIYTYQLQMIFRLSHFIERLDARLRWIAPSEIPYFAWESESRGLADARRSDGLAHPPRIKLALTTASNLQRVPFAILAGFGLGVLALLLRTRIMSEGLDGVFVLFGLVFVLLMSLWGALFSVNFGLHQWLQEGKGWSHSLLAAVVTSLAYWSRGRAVSKLKVSNKQVFPRANASSSPDHEPPNINTKP